MLSHVGSIQNRSNKNRIKYKINIFCYFRYNIYFYKKNKRKFTCVMYLLQKIVIACHLILFFEVNLSAQNLIYQDTLHSQINFQQGYSAIDPADDDPRKCHRSHSADVEPRTYDSLVLCSYRYDIRTYTYT